MSNRQTVPIQAIEATHRHYKGGYYRLLFDHVPHTETGEELVIYEHIWPNEKYKKYARPRAMFYGTVVLPPGVTVLRFEPVG